MNRTSSHDLEDRCASITLARQGDRADSNRLPPGSQPGPSTTSGSVTAEGMGFEPTRPLAQSHGLANRPDQPYSATFRRNAFHRSQWSAGESNPDFLGANQASSRWTSVPFVCALVLVVGAGVEPADARLSTWPLCQFAYPTVGNSESWIRTKRNRTYETQPGCLPLANVLLSAEAQASKYVQWPSLIAFTTENTETTEKSR